MDFATLVMNLPSLIGLVMQFIALVKKKGAPGTITQMSLALSDLDKAKTHEEHADAAKSLALALKGNQP